MESQRDSSNAYGLLLEAVADLDVSGSWVKSVVPRSSVGMGFAAV